MSFQPLPEEINEYRKKKLENLSEILFQRIDGWGHRSGKIYNGILGPLIVKIPRHLAESFKDLPNTEGLAYFGYNTEGLVGISNDSFNRLKNIHFKVSGKFSRVTN